MTDAVKVAIEAALAAGKIQIEHADKIKIFQKKTACVATSLPKSIYFAKKKSLDAYKARFLIMQFLPKNRATVKATQKVNGSSILLMVHSTTLMAILVTVFLLGWNTMESWSLALFITLIWTNCLSRKKAKGQRSTAI